MKSTAILLTCFSLLGTVLTYRDITVFEREIDGEGKCLSRLPTNHNVYGNTFQPVGYTLESFISLVEKVEFHHPQLDIFEITNMLLERFYFSDILFQPVSGRRRAYINPLVKYRAALLLDLLTRGSAEVRPVFDEGALNEDEKCSLYFMIGHNINNTYRGKIDTFQLPNGSPNNLESGLLIDGKDFRILPPREQGVVSLHSDSFNAVAMGRVLLGVAAGEFKDMKKKLRDLGVKETEYQEREFDVLTALTLGDAIANAEFKGDDKNGATKYGPHGEWNSTTCPTEYRLLKNTTSTTDAELRGAIDGYILGTYVKRMRDTAPDQLKLSRLIRMYYGRYEIKVENNMFGFCLRSSNLDGQVHDTAAAIFIFFCTQKSMKPDEISLGAFTKSFEDYSKYVSQLDMKDKSSTGYHQEYDICTRVKHVSGPTTIPEYDTPVDLFVVLDVTEHNTFGFDYQIDVVGHLAGHMDIGNGAGSVTVLLNSKGQQQLFIKNETNSACATCKLTRMDLRGVERDNLASVMELLNRTLKEYEEARRYEPGVPAKTVIFFHYDTNMNDEDQKRVREAKRILHSGHRDVHIFVVGNNNGDVLGNIANGQSTIFPDNDPSVKLANRIREEIKKVPATLQYHECGKPRSKVEDSHYYTGYVTPRTKQMWAMYPEYFLKSYTIDFKFKPEANSGKIRVCHDRDSFDPSLHDKNNDRCQTSETNGQEIKFTITNPCHGYDRDNCKPIYFSVEGLHEDLPEIGQSCSDANCRRTDQIKFTVSHKGVACSGALGLLASPLVLLGIIYATLRHL